MAGLLLTTFARTRRFVRSDDNFMLVLAAVVGTAGAVSVIGFRSAVAGIRTFVWGWPAYLSDHVLGVPWWQVLLVPTLGGVAVGWFMQRTLDGRAYGVMDVVYSAANPKERMRTRPSLLTALVGGDFSASLLLGATTGALFAAAVHALIPGASAPELYALIGMGAVAAAVMGAPLTTILIISEPTADFSITVAVMISVVIAAAVVQSVYGRSVVEWKLARRM